MISTICCIGGNKAGGMLSTVIASRCPEIRVDVIDNEPVISKWNKNLNPINEPGYDKMLAKCRNRNLFFSSSYAPIKRADMVIVSIDLPCKKRGCGEGLALDLKPLEEVARLIASHGETDKIVIEKTGVPRAAEDMSLLLNANRRNGVHYVVLSNPLFWEETLDNLLNVDRVVIGCPNNPTGRQAAESLSWIYEHWIPRKNIIILNLWSAALTRLVMSCFLAQEQASINTFTEICEKTGADVSEISRLIAPSEGIGSTNLTTSINLGGMREEILRFLLMCDCLKLPEVYDYWENVLDYSDSHRERFKEKLSEILSPLANKRISVWGVTGKLVRHSIQNAPALNICKFLLTHGAKLSIYEPLLNKHEILSELSEWKGVSENTIFVSRDPYEASADTHAIIVCNDCDNMKDLNFLEIHDKMKRPRVLVDGRKCLDSSVIAKSGFIYHTVGMVEDTSTPSTS